MRDILTFFNEILVDEDLKTELYQAVNDGEVVEFFAKHGVVTTQEELNMFAKEQVVHAIEAHELVEEDLAVVAGGASVGMLEMFTDIPLIYSPGAPMSVVYDFKTEVVQLGGMIFREGSK